MTKYQRTQLEGWLVILFLFIGVSIFQEKPFIAHGLFVPCIIWGLFNWNALEYIRKTRPTPIDVINKNAGIQKWLLFGVGIQLVIPFAFIFTSHDLGKIITGFGTGAIAILFPFIPAIVISERERFRHLGNEPN